jgi:hypothetical protein
VSIGKPSSSPKKWSFHGSLGLEKSETCENIGMKGGNERNDLEEVEVARVHTVETISGATRLLGATVQLRQLFCKTPLPLV